MHIDVLKKANQLLHTLGFLQQFIHGIEHLVGLDPEHKAELKDTAQKHNEAVQKQLDEL